MERCGSVPMEVSLFTMELYGVLWTRGKGLVGAQCNDYSRRCEADSYGLGLLEGITRYRRNTVPSTVRIIAVNVAAMGADKRYKPSEKSTIHHRWQLPSPSNIKPLISKPTHRSDNIAIEFEKLIGRMNPPCTRPYFPPTKERTFAWTPQKAGVYIFEVRAIDRDLNSSAPASVTLKVVPQWYLNGWIAIPIGDSGTYGISSCCSLFSPDVIMPSAVRHCGYVRRCCNRSKMPVNRRKRNANTLRSLAHAVKNPLAIIEACSENLAMLEDADSPCRKRILKMPLSKFLPKRLENRLITHVRRSINCLRQRRNPNFGFLICALRLRSCCTKRCKKIRDWKHKITLTKQCEAIPHINGDADKLRMGFENLFINACEAMEETGGTLTLRMTRTVDAVRIDIQDTGCGIRRRSVTKCL